MAHDHAFYCIPSFCICSFYHLCNIGWWTPCKPSLWLHRISWKKPHVVSFSHSWAIYHSLTFMQQLIFISRIVLHSIRLRTSNRPQAINKGTRLDGCRIIEMFVLIAWMKELYFNFHIYLDCTSHILPTTKWWFYFTMIIWTFRNLYLCSVIYSKHIIY